MCMNSAFTADKAVERQTELPSSHCSPKGLAVQKWANVAESVGGGDERIGRNFWREKGLLLDE